MLFVGIYIIVHNYSYEYTPYDINRPIAQFTYRNRYKQRLTYFLQMERKRMLSKVKVSAVIVARNERRHIKKTLRSLKRSTVPLFIVLVDDGSTDQIARIAKPYVDDVARLPFHEDSLVGRPELAERWNVGLKLVPSDSDYVMLLGADHPLPKKYVERIVGNMIRDNVIIASGVIRGERFTTKMPRPSGIVYFYMWFKMIGFFPVNWGWESYPVVKAKSMGYKTVCYRNVKSKTLRKVRLLPKKLFAWGKGLKALGYTPSATLEIAYDLHSLAILEGFYQDNVEPYSDIAEFVRNGLEEERFGAIRDLVWLLDEAEKLGKDRVKTDF